MSRTNLPYPEAFRAEAVELVRTSGKSVPAAIVRMILSSVLDIEGRERALFRDI